MGLLDDKTVVIFGVANKRSIAWGCAQEAAAQGAKLVLAYQNERMQAAVEKLVPDLPAAPLLAPCDVTVEGQSEAFWDTVKAECGTVHGMVHSIAFAKREELGGRFHETSWDGYSLAQQVSAYSLIQLARGAAPLMSEGGGIVCMTYYGSERVVDGYNVMGVAKAALEANMRYLAGDLGPQGIRVNAVSAGPIKTVSAMGVSGFKSILGTVAEKAPLRRNVSQEDVGQVTAFLLSDLSSGVTGQTIYVDAGYSILGV
ncbi:MAG TPA: NADH-specific enoyl-ACP reductase [Planctomycetes bacterium]|nr:NADH-specific enoyl-ACP reductase [Planctomycetota bacterium]